MLFLLRVVICPGDHKAFPLCSWITPPRSSWNKAQFANVYVQELKGEDQWRSINLQCQVGFSGQLRHRCGAGREGGWPVWDPTSAGEGRAAPWRVRHMSYSSWILSKVTETCPSSPPVWQVFTQHETAPLQPSRAGAGHGPCSQLRALVCPKVPLVQTDPQKRVWDSASFAGGMDIACPSWHPAGSTTSTQGSLFD